MASSSMLQRVYSIGVLFFILVALHAQPNVANT
jgi:hypothetical protein